jgi:O-antigen/teichoic acid export membrane protein
MRNPCARVRVEGTLNLSLSPTAAARRFGSSPYAWSLVDQALSSATTLSLTLITARLLGPTGLGTVALGYAAILVALGLERAVIIDPLLTRIRTPAGSEHDAFEAAGTTTLFGGLALSVLGLVLGLSATGTWARAMLIFSPWIVPVIAHAFLKAWLYRERRARIATASSAVWLAIMLGALAMGVRSTDWQIVAAWGAGGCGAAVIAAIGTVERVRIARSGATLAWFRREALGIGAWRAAASMMSSVAAYAQAAGISAILGPAALGGYRAIETLFSPTTLITPAFVSAGLPPLRTAVEERRAGSARSLVLKISGLSVGLVLVYVLVLVVLKDYVIGLFGGQFGEYEDLIAPVVAAQLLFGTGTGFGILVLAARRVRAILGLTVLHAGLTLALTLALAATRGLEAAAWGVALGSAVPVMLTIVLGRRIERELARTPSTT